VSVYVFTGPTLSADEGRQHLDAVFLPPAAQGDIYRAALERPVAIAIIDGYFERIPSVSHKEVLWAMSQGVHVLGAASMGALRAAELAPFGMEGVGTIFQAYQRGELEADDEVALTHSDAEDGYRPTSEPLVNIRATLRAAEEAGVLDARARAAFEQVARSLFYPDRCYPLLLARAATAGLSPADCSALQAFLPSNQANPKRQDAILLLSVLRERFSGPCEPKRVRYHFENTDAWEFIRARARQRAFEPGATALAPAAPWLEQQGDVEAVRWGTLARALALELARKHNRTIQGAVLRDAMDHFRRARGLLAAKDFQRWVEEQGIVDVERFFQDEAQVQWAQTLFDPEARRLVADHLRSLGLYGHHKQE